MTGGHMTSGHVTERGGLGIGYGDGGWRNGTAGLAGGASPHRPLHGYDRPFPVTRTLAPAVPGGPPTGPPDDLEEEIP
jgi:hypothetical protein